jgi:hypothetical protein
MVSVLASSAVDRGFIGGVMVSVLASILVDRGFEPRSGQTKDNNIGTDSDYLFGIFKLFL